MATIDQYGSSPDHFSGTPADWNEENTVARAVRRRRPPGRLGRLPLPPLPADERRARRPTRTTSPPRRWRRSSTRGRPARRVSPPRWSRPATAPCPADAAGKIVVVSQLAKGALDPSIAAAIAAGAKGLVYVTEGVGDLPKKEDVNSRKGTGDFPVLLVGQKSGAEVLADAEAGENADLTLQAQLGTATDYDVWGELPGADDSRRVFVGTPVSSFVPSASERGGGVAILLGLAKHYAELPRSQRPETLVFLATTGHEVGFLGLEALIEAKGSWFTDADAYVHMGASLGAPTGVENPDGSISVTTCRPPASASTTVRTRCWKPAR